MPWMERQNYLPIAIYSLQRNADQLVSLGRQDSPEWHLANGLLRIARGIQQDASILEARLVALEARLSPQQ